MDPLPQYQSAGIVHIGDEESTALAIAPSLDPRNKSKSPLALTQTPNQTINSAPAGLNDQESRLARTEKFRKEFQQQAGLRFIHTGLHDLPLPNSHIRHGIKTSTGDRAGDCFVMGPDSELQNFLVEQKESIYRSHQREPLARAYIRGHNLPNYTKQDQFKFGMKTDSSESAKNLIYYPTQPSLHRKHGNFQKEDIYVSNHAVSNKKNNDNPSDNDNNNSSDSNKNSKSSGNLEVSFSSSTSSNGPLALEKEVTRQINREYNWAATKVVDPTTHRFGLTHKHQDPNAPSTMHTGTATQVRELLSSYIPGENTDTIASQRVQAHRARTNDALGKGKPVYGTVALLEQKGTTYGSSVKRDEFGARECLRGTYKEDEQAPDIDLGISVKKANKIKNEIIRNGTSTQSLSNDSRVFGVPSIRSDLRGRGHGARRSIANDINYGDESDGKGLLYPSTYSSDGVNEEDFLAARSPNEIKAIFARIDPSIFNQPSSASTNGSSSTSNGLTFKQKEFERICEMAVKEYGILSVDSFRHCWNRVKMEILCEICDIPQCQHQLCKSRPCRHNEFGNHSQQAGHAKQDLP